MNTAAKLAAYGVALALVAGGGWAVGTAAGPFTGSAAPAGSGETGTPSAKGGAHGDVHGGTGAQPAGPDQPDGLASSSGGYTFTPAATTLPRGERQPFSFRIVGPDGKAVTGFDVEHEKRMHLIVVRRDTAGFQHVHPKMAADGTWTVPLDLSRAGTYRAFADFAPRGGQPTTLGTDLAVPGDYQPTEHPPAREARVDGYRVRLDGELVPGRSSEVTLTVHKNGERVTDLQPYLGAYGHLVALRTGDLAYLHVHPEGTPGDGKTRAGPSVTFFAEVPSTGTYRLFLDFKHAGQVRTAEFTVPARGTTAPGETVPAPTDHGHGGHN